ncbi:MAG: hypothetical protein AB7T31_15830 [Gemmatimonadales bacterium]
MPHIRQQAALAAVVCLLASCQQTDQQLPFELDGGGQTVSIGPSGGLISVPPNFSIEIPAGALATTVSVAATQRVTAFPNDAGELVPISAFDVGPAGTSLLLPARVQIKVPPELLDAGDELSLALALLTNGGDVTTQVTSYDLNNGFLTADIMQLGPVAAVVASDAIAVLDLDDIPALSGGSFAPPSPVSGGGALAPPPPPPPGTVQFWASCSTSEQRCFSSGIVQVWVDDVIRDRLGRDIVLYNANVEGFFQFSSFVAGRPTVAYGYLTLDGELRARLNSVVAGRRTGQEIEMFTGGGSSPSTTAVTFSGNAMTLAQTSEDSPATIEYSVAGVGTGEQLTLQFEGDIEFSNPSPQPPSLGHIVVQVRLRR